MLKRNHLVLLMLLVLNTASAQVKWPAVTQTAKPWTRWWWEGSAVNRQGLTTAMEAYAKAGLGGLEITPIYGVKGYEQQFIPYLTPAWMDMLQHTLREGQRLGLGIDMATGTGWPFGGPWITEAEASKYLAHKVYTLKAGEQLGEPVQYLQEPILRSANPQSRIQLTQLKEPVIANADLQLLALDQVRFVKPLPLVCLMAYDDQGKTTDITNKVGSDGKLNWSSSKHHTLYALFQGWHGKMVERAAPGGEGLAIDHFSLPAIEHYLGYFDKSFTGHDLSGLRSFFNDSYEVDDARGEANWTPGFFDAFLKKRGYDLREQLPALLAKDPRVLYDYRMAISALLLEKFTKPWHAWAAAKGKLIRNQSHGSPSNILDLYDAIDIPETEGTDILRFKFATSAANVSGKPLASAEAATWLNEHFLSSLGDVKMAMDKYFVGGVNHIFYHGTNYSPQNEPWPGWLFYAAVHFTPANPFWKDFGALNSYVARCQSFLQQSKSDNDILLYFPFHDRNSQPGRAMLHHFDGMEGFDGTYFKQAGEELLEEGYTFDLISDLQLQKTVAEKGKVRTSGGATYQAVLLADVKYLPLETLEKLRDLAQSGVTILMFENMPQDVPGFYRLEERRAAFRKAMQELAACKTVHLNNHLSELMHAGKIRQEHIPGLMFTRKAYDKGHYYFLSNPGQNRFRDYITLSSKSRAAFVFDPMQERAGVAITKNAPSGSLQVYVDLEPGESCILQTSATPLKGALFPYTMPAGPATVLDSEWDVKFVEGGPSLPPSTKVKQLNSWTEWSLEGTAQFSGTAIYTTGFNKPATTADAYELDLGQVNESASVILNGKKLATLIGPVFKLTIPATELKAVNILQVTVTNGMANRIADMDKKGLPWKKFYNTNMPARLAENRGADGLFTAAGWQPRTAGLTGPVTLTPVKTLSAGAMRTRR